MRRLLVTVTLIATLMASVGCSSQRAGHTGAATSTSTVPAGTPSPDGAATAPASPGAAGVVTGPAGGNAKEVCASAIKLSATAIQTFFTELSKMLQAGSTGDTEGATAAKGKAEAALKNWSKGLGEQADRATDPQLKAVLDEIGAEVAGMRVDLDSIDEVELERLRQRLDTLCGR